MQTITLRVLQGADRGRTFENLKTPITIGREEGNAVQLNDERISRYHVKIQEDDGRLVVTDLDSTNGTRVNGNLCSLKILRAGDTISVGRTILMVGDAQGQIKDFLGHQGPGIADEDLVRSSTRIHVKPGADAQKQETCLLPRGLSPGQAAELRELLDHIHNGIRIVVESAQIDEKRNNAATVDQNAWRQLLLTHADIATLIRTIEGPSDSKMPMRDTGAEA